MGGRTRGPSFVGRQAELEKLTSLLQQADTGRGAAVLLGGEAGVGKTRLVQEFADFCSRSGATVLRGGCLAVLDGGLPYAPVVEALQDLARRSPPEALEQVLGSARRELSRLVPELDDTPGSTEPLDRSAQGRLFSAISDVLLRLGEAEPVVLIVEDLHWADRSTLDVLTFLFSRLQYLPLLVVATFRSDDLVRGHPLRSWLAQARRGRADDLELRRFTQEEVVTQLGVVLEQPPDRTTAELLYRRSQGNAFFVEELAAALEHGPALPVTLREMLLARVEQLTALAVEVVRAVAVGGLHVDHDLLGRVVALSRRQLDSALREAVDLQVLVASDAAYCFRHALTREAVYGELLPGERMQLHAAFAEALEKQLLGATVAPLLVSAEIAHHWFAAHDLPVALEAAATAATAAEAAPAWGEAHALWERVLTIWTQVADSELRVGLDRAATLQRASEAAARGGAPKRAAALVQAALELVDDDAEPVRAGLLWERLGHYRWMAGLPDAVAACIKAATLVPDQPATPDRALVLASVGHALMLTSRYRDSRHWCEEAVVMAVRTRARAQEARARGTLGVDLALLGDADTGIAYLLAARRIAEEAGDDEDRLRSYVNLSAVYAEVARFAEAAEVALEGLGVARELGLEAYAGVFLRLSAAEALFNLGHWREAQYHTDEVDERAIGGVDMVFLHTLQGELACGRGDFEVARSRLETVLSLCRPVADAQMATPIYTALAELALWEARIDDAHAAVIAGLDALGEGDDEWLLSERLYALALRTEADRAADQPSAGARSHAASAVRVLDEARAFGTRAKARAPMAIVAAWEAEATRLRHDHSPQAWRAAAEGWVGRAMPYQVAYGLWRQAEAIAGLDAERDELEGVLQRAGTIAAELGARPLIAQLRNLAQRAGIQLATLEAEGRDAGAGSDARLSALTPREREVLELVTAGLGNRQIAQRLSISDKTVSVHVSHMMAKLGVRSRGEAAALAVALRS